MKQVFEQYASAMIAAFLALILLTFIWSGSYFQQNGIPQVLGQMLTYSIGERGILEHSAFWEYRKGAAPTITKREDVLVVANQRIRLSDCFEARSYQGEALSVFLKNAWTENGEETDLGISSDGTSIYVSEAGVYWVQLYTVDENRKESSIITKLLVNER